MHSLKIGVAQISSRKGDVAANRTTHIKAIEGAGSQGVHYLVFPELSLTGYEPELAAKLAFSVDDTRLSPLAACARRNNVCLGVGAPLATDGRPQIGLLIIPPDGPVEVYAKMNLHSSEERFFSPGVRHHMLNLGGSLIANAICADANHPSHAGQCAAMGAAVYIVGALISENGYTADTAALAARARDFNMLVALANHNRPTGSWCPAGKSAIWTPAGLLTSADETQNALVMAEKTETGWKGSQIVVQPF